MNSVQRSSTKTIRHAVAILLDCPQLELTEYHNKNYTEKRRTFADQYIAFLDKHGSIGIGIFSKSAGRSSYSERTELYTKKKVCYLALIIFCCSVSSVMEFIHPESIY